MSHERYTLEQRLSIPFKDSLKPKAEETVYGYDNGHGEAVLIPGVNCSMEEAQSLIERGAIFPLEIAQPVPATIVFEREPHI